MSSLYMCIMLCNGSVDNPQIQIYWGQVYKLKWTRMAQIIFFEKRIKLEESYYLILRIAIQLQCDIDRDT